VHITRPRGFGRRGSNEFSIEAAAMQSGSGHASQLTWSREHDFAHDNYRSNGWPISRRPDGTARSSRSTMRS